MSKSLVSVEIEKKSLMQMRLLSTNAPKKLRKAQVSGVNLTVKNVKTQFAKQISGEVAIKQKDVKKSIAIRRAKRGGMDEVSGAVTLMKDKRLPLKYFTAKQLKKGVKYKIDKRGSRKLAEGAFGPKIVKLGSHVFRRAGKGRLPLIKLHGPSAWGVIATKPDQERKVEQYAKKRFEINTQHEINYQFLKWTGKV